MKKLLKFLHEVGTVGVMGAVAAQLILSFAAADLAPVEHAALRQGIVVMCRWLLIPSLGLVLISGLLAMALHKPFHNADWSWVKAIMTPLILESTFLVVESPARAAAELSRKVAEGDPSAGAVLAQALYRERWGLFIVLGLFTANIVLAVWRPRLRPRIQKAQDEASKREGKASEGSLPPPVTEPSASP